MNFMKIIIKKEIRRIEEGWRNVCMAFLFSNNLVKWIYIYIARRVMWKGDSQLNFYDLKRSLLFKNICHFRFSQTRRMQVFGFFSRWLSDEELTIKTALFAGYNLNQQRYPNFFHYRQTFPWLTPTSNQVQDINNSIPTCSSAVQRKDEDFFNCDTN